MRRSDTGNREVPFALIPIQTPQTGCWKKQMNSR